MTEKRFTLSEDKYNETIFNNGIAMGIIDVVEKLNELFDENEQLKSEINMLKKTIGRIDRLTKVMWND